MQSDPDKLAKSLARMGAIARSQPPAWDGCEMSMPVLSPTLGTIGRMLPGRGLYLAFDLKTLGINKPIRNVYEPSKIAWLMDRFTEASYWLAKRAENLKQYETFDAWMRHPERGTVASYDNIISARVSKTYDIKTIKSSITTTANVWHSMFRAGGIPTAGAYTNIPTGTAPTKSTTGALSFGLTNPTAPDKQYLLTVGCMSTQQLNMVEIVDLLGEAGNISATSTGSQTISLTALTRYTSGAGVWITCPVTTALGTTASNLTITYTNQAGTGSRSTGAQAMTTSAIAERLMPAGLGNMMQLASGDYGVQTIASAVFSASMLAGVIAVNLYKSLCWFPALPANMYAERDSSIQIDGLTELVQTSGNVLGCYVAYIIPNGATSGNMTVTMRTAQG